jgi:cysteine desulfurase family protein
MIYFDNAATTLKKPHEVCAAVQTAMRTMASPGRGGYREAMEAAEAVYRCREQAAELFDAVPENVVFTMNATHALNLAIKTLVAPGSRVVLSGFEHNAVWRPLHGLGAKLEIAGTRLFAPEDTLARFHAAITPDTAAVICTQVSNVFGYILPVEELGALCRAKGVPLIIDASQSAGTLPVSMTRTGAAFIAMPGHKGLYGPQGTGMLLCARLPEPLLEGGTGSQSALPQMPDFLPDRAEAGTQNVAGICGLSAGLSFLKKRGMRRIAAQEQQCRAQLCEGLRELPGLIVYAGDEKTQSGVVSFRMPDTDCEELARELSERSVAVRAGLHCAPLAHRSAGTEQTGTVRASFSAFNTTRQVDEFLSILKKLCR